MSGTENEAPSVKRSSEIKRAYRLRRKPEDQRSDEDKEWLAHYDAHKRGGIKPADGSVEPETVPEVDGGDAEDTAPGDSIPAPPPPPPPRVSANVSRSEDEPHGNTGTGWKRKYQGGSNGREKTVLVIASQWRGLLQFCSDQIVMSGGTPLVKLDDIWPAMVMTVDDFLPEKVAIKPAHIALGGSTAIIIQRVMRHKKIGEAYAAGESMPRHEPPVSDATPPQAPAPAQDTEVPVAPPTTPPVAESVPPPMEPVIHISPEVVIDMPEPGSVF